MKKIYLLIIYSFIVLSSCSKEDTNSQADTPVEVTPNITISAINKDFIIEGEELVITGTNFIKQNEQTKLLFKSQLTNQIIEKNVTPTSNTEIRFVITNDILLERNLITVNIAQKTSNITQAFILKKGWFKINLFSSTSSIKKTYIFDDTEDIFFNGGTIPQNGGAWYNVSKLSINNLGYSGQNLTYSNTQSATNFSMFNKTIGSISTYASTLSTNNAFGSVIQKDLFYNETNLDANTLQSDDSHAYYFNQSKLLYYNGTGSEFLSQDGGNSFVYVPQPYITKRIKFSGPAYIFKSAPYIREFGKSSSNNKYYKIGYRLTKERVNATEIIKNLVLESQTGTDNWTIIDSTTVYNFAGVNPKFKSINKIFSLYNQNLYTSSNFQQSWSIFKTNVKFFSIRNENDIYIQQNDAIYKSLDNGQTWILELNLPTNSVVNDISFSSNKVIVSGEGGLLYIKHE